MRKFVARHTDARWKKFSEELRRAAKSPEDADAIHDLRVSIRRFVQCLRSFGDFFDADAVKAVRKPLRRLMRRCGDVRNCDIAIDLLNSANLGSDPAVEVLRTQRQERQDKMAKTLRRWRKSKIDWKESPGKPKNPSWPVLPEMSAELVQAGDAAARADASYEEIHRFRIQGKRFRYTVELFETELGELAPRALKELKSLQDKLGNLNDCVTAMELLRGHRKPRAAVGKLLKQRTQAFQDFWLNHFRSTWTSTFSDMAKPIPEVPASKKKRVRSRPKASAT